MHVALLVGHSHGKRGARSGAGVTEWGFWSEAVWELAAAIMARRAGKGCAVSVHTRHDAGYSAAVYRLVGALARSKPDVALEFHLNSASVSASGTETLYPAGNVAACLLAETLQASMVRALELRDRGAKARSEQDRGGKLLHSMSRAGIPCVILEPCFLSNPADMRRLRGARTALMRHLAEAIVGALED